MIESQDLIMGFQPILQSKIVGPNYSGPIYVTDRVKRDKSSSRFNSNSQSNRKKIQSNRYRNRQAHRVNLNLQATMVTDEQNNDGGVTRNIGSNDLKSIQYTQSGGETYHE